MKALKTEAVVHMNYNTQSIVVIFFLLQKSVAYDCKLLEIYCSRGLKNNDEAFYHGNHFFLKTVVVNLAENMCDCKTMLKIINTLCNIIWVNWINEYVWNYFAASKLQAKVCGFFG